jgi:hypothetical protein
MPFLSGQPGRQALQGQGYGGGAEEITNLYQVTAIPRSDKGHNYSACAYGNGSKLVRNWFETFIQLSLNTSSQESPGNGLAESFKSRFRDEFLNTELFTTAPPPQLLADRLRCQ